MKKQKRKPKVFLWLLLIILIGGAALSIFKVFGPNTGSFHKGQYLFIHTGARYADVLDALQKQSFIKDIKTFDFLARQAKYPSNVKAGRYRIKKGMSNYDLIKMLRSGRQEPVRLVINKLRTKEDFINYISTRLEADSVVLRNMLNDPVYLAQFGLDTNTALAAIIPDTYEFWWNTDADKAYRKFEKYYAQFWTDDRKDKAEALGLTPIKVVVLASIIEEETNNNKEKPLIASVYLNRLKKGMPLQADPTARFAFGDFTVRRITRQITSIPSPYNTYQTTGLPPGPICTPSKKTIEAVLSAPETDYLYFCAKDDFSGAHIFSSTYADHLANARKYQKALNTRGIR